MKREDGSQKPAESRPSSRRAAPSKFISGFRPFSTRRVVKTGRVLSRSYCEKKQQPEGGRKKERYAVADVGVHSEWARRLEETCRVSGSGQSD